MKTDEQLISATNAGDSEAFETLYLRYRDWVYALAMRFTGNTTHAADTVQETFLYFLKKFPGFELRCSLKTFLYPVVRHIAITLGRHGRRAVSDEAAFAQLPTPNAASADGPRGDLEAVMATLPAEQRQVVLMRFVDEMSLGEVAEVLEVPVNTVKSRLYRALEALRSDPRARQYFLD